MATVTQPAATGSAATSQRLSPRAECITVALATWLMVGLFVDGWAHTHVIEGEEGFFTPWHALLYSGFAATAGWVLWQVRSRQRGGQSWREAVPAGYGLGLAGVAIFAFGGAADMLWHEILGIETDIDALFSPPHILLFAGLGLILTSPARAAWRHDPRGAAPGYRAFLPVILSLTLVTALVMFFFQYWSPFDWRNVARIGPGFEAEHLAPVAATDPDIAGGFEIAAITKVVAAVMATTIVLLTPLLLAVRRWQPPVGTATTLFTVTSVMLNAIGEFRAGYTVAAAVAGGLAADALVRWLGGSASRRRTAVHAVAAAVPAVTWSTWFLLAFAATGGTWWDPELWTGTIVWASLAGLGLSLLLESASNEPGPRAG